MTYPTSFQFGALFNDDGALMITTSTPSPLFKNGRFPTDSTGQAFIDFTNTPTANTDPIAGGLCYRASTGALFTSLSAPASSAVVQGGTARSATGQLHCTFTPPSPGFLNGGLKTNGVGSVYCAVAPAFELRFADLGAGIVSTTETVGGVAATFTRATSAWTNLSDGTIGLVASGSPRSYYSPTGTYLGYLAEGARTNLCQRGEDFATVWTDVGTPTLSANTVALGVLNLSTVGDDSAAALEGKIQTIAFTGDAVKAISIYVKQGTSTSSVIRVRDTSAAADRLLAAVTWSGTTPVITMTTGTDLTGTPQQQGTSGVYRLLFATTSVTAANTNSLQIYPATDAALATANIGTILVGGVQAEDALFPSSLIRTPGSATVTRNADVLTYPTTGWMSATVGTVLLRGVTPLTDAVVEYAWSINEGVGNELYGVFRPTTANLRALVVDGGATQASMDIALATSTTFKHVFSYAANDFAAVVNGGTVSTDTSGTLPTVTTLNIGNQLSSTFGWYSTIFRFTYWNLRLTNTQDQQLSAT